MKQITLLLVLNFSVIFTLNAQEENTFTLNGSITGKPTGMLYLRYSNNNKTITDSSVVKDGQFVFTGQLQEPSMAELFDNIQLAGPEYKNYCSDFYIGPGSMNLFIANNAFSKMKLSGSKSNDDYQILSRYLNPVSQNITRLENQKEKNSVQQKMITDSLAYYKKNSADILQKFIHEHQNSFITLVAIQKLGWTNKVSLDSCLVLLNALDNSVQHYNTAVFLKSSYIAEISSAIGHEASDFTRKDVNGRLVQLSSFKGKYVLLDFWASWCEPCREQTPHIKELFKKYASKGLNIIAISCDTKYDAWQQAIHQDGLDSLVNILSFSETDMDFLKSNENARDASFKGELRKQYNFMPIPTSLLIDRNGVIADRFEPKEKNQLEHLDKKLAEIFGY